MSEGAKTPRIHVHTRDGSTSYFADDPLVGGGRPGCYVLEKRSLAAGSLPVHSFDDHVLMLSTGTEAVRFQSRLEGRRIRGTIEPGKLRFLRAGDGLATSWNGNVEAIFLAVNQNLLLGAPGVESHAPVLVSNLMPHMDPIIAHLIWVLNAHVHSGRLEGQLFEQSIMTAIGARLIRAYGVGIRAVRGTAVLPRWKVARAESFMRERFRDPIALEDIAAAVALSPFHLSRAFRASTGKSVWQFVLECRATEAGRLMRAQPDRPLLDLSIDCGFESYSQFIAAFRKFFGQLPSQYRRTVTG